MLIINMLKIDPEDRLNLKHIMESKYMKEFSNKF